MLLGAHAMHCFLGHSERPGAYLHSHALSQTAIFCFVPDQPVIRRVDIILGLRGGLDVLHSGHEHAYVVRVFQCTHKFRSLFWAL
jgi:hypothetical protein